MNDARRRALEDLLDACRLLRERPEEAELLIIKRVEEIDRIDAALRAPPPKSVAPEPPSPPPTKPQPRPRPAPRRPAPERNWPQPRQPGGWEPALVTYLMVPVILLAASVFFIIQMW